MLLNERARCPATCGRGAWRCGAGGSLQLFMLMHALRTCFGSSRVRSTSSRHFKNKVSVTDRCYRCTERVSVHFVRPAAQSISSCTGSVPEVDLDKIELLRLGTFLYPSWFGTVRHVSVRPRVHVRVRTWSARAKASKASSPQVIRALGAPTLRRRAVGGRRRPCKTLVSGTTEQ